MVQDTYTVTLSPSCSLTASYNSIKGLPVSHADVAQLSTTNYPAGSTVANSANQAIFMNLPVSWWIDSFNSSSIQYRPVSGDVNWAFIDANMNEYHISREITDVMIPNRTDTAIHGATPMDMTVTFKDNNVLLLTHVRKM